MRDEYYMGLALKQAAIAAELDEVPVGAVVVSQWGQIIGLGHNLKESRRDATCHAEMMAIREACHSLNSWRLLFATIYVTLEPCPMCAGAMVQARLQRLIYAAPDPKAGAAGSIVDLLRFSAFNHQLEVIGGLREVEATRLLKDFFQGKRK